MAPFDSIGLSPTIAPQTPTQPVEAWRQVLLDAADKIERDGWCQGQRIIDGRVCAHGAIEASITGDARGRHPLHDAASVHLYHYLGRQNPGGSMCILTSSGCAGVGGWNDAPGRTAAEVCAALRGCARSA